MIKQKNKGKILFIQDHIENLGTKLNISLKDLLKNYSKQDINIIEATKDFLVELWFTNINNQTMPNYVATAGTPGVGKSYYIEHTELGCSPNNDYVYIDPDRVALKSIVINLKYLDNKKNNGMKESVSFSDFYNDIVNNNKEVTISKDQYNKWRDASNYISNYMLLQALMLRVNIIHGTTSSNPKVAKLLKYLCDERYSIDIKLFQAPEFSRQQAIEKRSKTVVQVSLEDAKNKAMAVYKNIPVYFEYATTIDFIMQKPNYSQKDNYNAMVAAKAYVNTYARSIEVFNEPEFLIFQSNIKQECQDKDSVDLIFNNINMLPQNIVKDDDKNNRIFYQYDTNQTNTSLSKPYIEENKGDHAQDKSKSVSFNL